LTTLQQADHYLGQLEQQLLDYRHSQRKGGQAQSTALMQMLDKRTALSGGAVDRQLQPVLQGEARVSFHSPELANLVHNPTPGTCMFSVSDGRQTQLSAVMLSEDDSAGQYQTRLTNALRRVGVQLHQQADGISFSTTEKQWPHIERTLSVRTDGDKSAFMPLKTFAEPSEADRLAQSLQQGGAGISQTLESINQQRAQMAVQQEKARQLIDGMSRFPQTENAVQASENLGGVLDSANHNYQVLLQAVNGQARISSQTVRNLLG
ncbi:flagellar hook-associated protein, partial [Escherichia coli]|nr:flagellar hook-associated protein [Escherichia coli]